VLRTVLQLDGDVQQRVAQFGFEKYFLKNNKNEELEKIQ
jgi:hypothetical protein